MGDARQHDRCGSAPSAQLKLTAAQKGAALVVFGILGHLLMIRAFATAPASDTAPYGYAGLLFAIIFGLTLYDESPDLITLLGAFVIVGVGLYVWSHERLTQAQKTHG